MAIDTLENTKRIRIKDLVIPDAQLPSNPRRDIPQAMWRTMEDRAMESVNITRNNAEINSENLNFLQRVGILFPDKLIQLVDDKLWKKLNEYGREEAVFDRKILAAAVMKVVNQDSTRSREFFNDTDWFWANQYIARNQGIAPSFIHTMYMLTIIDHEKVKKDFIGDESWQKAKIHIDVLKNKDDTTVIAANLLAYIKVIDQEKLEEMGLDREFWDRMKRRLFEDFERDNIASVIDLASAMSILAAKEIKITDSGMKLVFDDQVSDLNTAKPVPERRKF